MKKCERCPRPHKAHGLCGAHLYRRDKGLPLDGEIGHRVRGGAVCNVDDGDGPCGNRHEAHGLCPMHLRRQQRRGRVGGSARQRSPFGQAVWDEPNHRRAKRLRNEYGMTTDEYDHLLAQQGGGCAICRSRSAQSSRAKADRSFCIDHDHETGHVRGLLCQSCNRGIGLLGDDPAVLEAAARYLRAARQIPLFGPAKSA